MLMLPRFCFLLTVCMCMATALPSVVPSTLSPPTNVSLTCHNFTTVLYWNYSQPDLQPEFNITINGYESAPKVLLTRQTYLDVSKYVQDPENSYYITVTAQMNGSEPQAAVNSAHFSYNEDFPSDITCVVDFPELEVSVFTDTVELSFPHPYYVHKVEFLRDAFDYTIWHNKTRGDYTCYVEDVVCKSQFHLFQSLNGTCMDVHIIGSVNSIPTEVFRKVCDPVGPSKTDWIILLTILLCSVVGLLVFIILAAMICKKLIQPDSQSTIMSKLLGKVNAERVLQVPEQAALSEVTSLGQTPLLDSPEQVPSDFLNCTPDFHIHLPTHLPTHFDSGGKLSEEEEPEDVMEDADSEDFNSGNSFSGYDSQKFPIDMGQGDIVEAYGPH